MLIGANLREDRQRAIDQANNMLMSNSDRASREGQKRLDAIAQQDEAAAADAAAIRNINRIINMKKGTI